MMRIPRGHAAWAVTQQSGYGQFTVAQLMSGCRITVPKNMRGHMFQTCNGAHLKKGLPEIDDGLIIGT
jgi:hypothetical protein